MGENNTDYIYDSDSYETMDEVNNMFVLPVDDLKSLCAEIGESRDDYEIHVLIGFDFDKNLEHLWLESISSSINNIFFNVENAFSFQNWK